MSGIKWLGLIVLALSAPVFGMELAMKTTPVPTLDTQIEISFHTAENDISPLSLSGGEVLERAKRIAEISSAYTETFIGQTLAIEDQIKKSENQQKLSDDIYEQRITAMLGEALSGYRSPQVEIKVFELKELDYRGFMAKVKIFDPKAIQVALAEDELGGFETTSSIAVRNRAMLAVNGGGFGSYTDEGSLISTMIGGTVSNSVVVQPFIPKDEPLFFAGVDKEGHVIGTVPKSQEDIDALRPKEGVSFLPVLLKNGKKVDLPLPWQNTLHPRTILGRYANNDLLLIVVDGRRAYWSKGVTLERLQDKLLELGVQDAYNLDGGGSSTFFYNGQVLNKPSDGKERPVANAFLIMP